MPEALCRDISQDLLLQLRGIANRVLLNSPFVGAIIRGVDRRNRRAEKARARRPVAIKTAAAGTFFQQEPSKSSVAGRMQMIPRQISR